MTDALAMLEQGYAMALSVARAPEEVLEEARRAAVALKGVIDAKPEDKKVKFSGETYLEFEDWQTVGRFYGIAPRIGSTKFLDLGEGVRGWEAVAEAVHVPTGRVVSSAEAMCMNDEEKWSVRPKYEWHYAKKAGGTSKDDPGRDQLIWEERKDGKGKAPKKVRVLAGEEKVPMFQLRSMAQTRAGAKAMRNALAWVVVLAGYRPTPAEEMPDHGGPGQVIDVTPEPERKIGEGPAAPRADSEAEARALFPSPEDDERNALVAEAQALAKRLKLTPQDRAAFKLEYLGGADPDRADVAALATMVAELRKRAGWTAA